MKKKKLNLQDLQIESIVTPLLDDEQQKIKGGFAIIRGRNTSQRTRWTSVDTRADMSQSFKPSFEKNFNGPESAI